jgi:hypothetical protein
MGEDDCTPTVSVTEPNFFDYTAWAFDHREELRDALREAGASEYLIRFIDTVEQGTRHSVLMTLFRHHGSSKAGPEEAAVPNVEDCKEAYRLSGGFMTKLWDGHLADAFCHADGNNRPMMAEEFDKEEIISVGLSNDGPFRQYDYLENLIGEKFETLE